MAFPEREALLADVAVTGAAWTRAASDATDGGCGASSTRPSTRRRAPSPWSPWAGTGGGSSRPGATSTSCSSTTAAGHRAGRRTDLVPGVGRQTEARALRPHGQGGARVWPPSDLDTATSLLTLAISPGTPSLTTASQRWISKWGKRSRRWLVELAAHVQRRHAGRGGCVPARARPEGRPGWPPRRPRPSLGGSGAAGAARRRRRRAPGGLRRAPRVRVELHRQARRPGDVLRLEEQDAVAAGSTPPMPTHSWRASPAPPAPSPGPATKRGGASVGLEGPAGRESAATTRWPLACCGATARCTWPRVDPASDPTLVLRVAVAAARHRAASSVVP